MVRGNYRDYPFEATLPLSRGTLEQIYLALRLALIDHLDKDREGLPLFLDEALINWDGIRLKNGLELLKQIAQNRQIFLFTCHEWMVEKLSGSDEVQGESSLSLDAFDFLLKSSRWMIVKTRTRQFSIV